MPSGSDVGSATSLDDFLASAFNEFGDSAGASDDDGVAQQASSVTEAPGAPPVEPPDGPSKDPSSPEGDETATDDADLVADPNAEPSPDPSTPAEIDYQALVKDAPSLSYRVNGEERTFPGLKVLEHGAVIDNATLPALQQRLSERDSLFERSQQQYKQYTDLEQLTAWKTAGPDGKEQILTGAPALEARSMALAKTDAIVKTLAAVFDDPEQFSALVSAKQLPDGRWVAMPDKTALNALITHAELNAMKAEQSVRSQFQGVQHTPQAQGQSPQIDITANAPTLVEHQASQLGVTTLTPEDKSFLASMLPKFVRTATQEDVALSPMLRMGEPVIDAAFGQLMEHQASLRSATTKTVQTVASVSKENAAKLAAAQAGKTHVKSHLRTVPQRQERDQRAEDADSAFAMMERAANGRF